MSPPDDAIEELAHISVPVMLKVGLMEQIEVGVVYPQGSAQALIRGTAQLLIDAALSMLDLLDQQEEKE